MTGGYQHQPVDVLRKLGCVQDTDRRSSRVREEVDLGQIQVPAQGFDIVDEVAAPVGGGVLRGCGVAGSAEVQEYEGAAFGQAAQDPSVRSSKATLPTSCCVGRAAPRFLHQPQLFAHALNRLCQAAAIRVNRVRIGFLCERVDGHATNPRACRCGPPHIPIRLEIAGRHVEFR